MSKFKVGAMTDLEKAAHEYASLGSDRIISGYGDRSVGFKAGAEWERKRAEALVTELVDALEFYNDGKRAREALTKYRGDITSKEGGE